MNLKEALKQHYLLKFPSNSIQSDGLADCYGKIAELDGYIVGLVEAKISVSNESRKKIDMLIGRLENISDLSLTDEKIKSNLLIYLNSLKQLATV
jgi:hypothetical protein